VSKACRYEPDLNPTYQEMATHYGVGVLPARPRKPRDKAKVEVGVQIAQRWIVAALRHRKFFSLQELNRAIRELLERLIQRPLQKREGSRRSLFVEVDQPALRPLPTERFDLSVWSQATVNRLSHPVRRQLLQRALSTDTANRGGAGYAQHHRDLPSRQARRLACACAQALHGGDQL